MSTPHPYLDRRQHDLDLLAAGEETGWWDEHGTPAPFPEDFWLADPCLSALCETPRWSEECVL